MTDKYVYVCILIMAIITFLTRSLAFFLFRKPIRNQFIRSFLYYAPYATLSVLIFPTVLETTSSITLSLVAFASAVLCSALTGNMFLTAVISCIVVYAGSFLI